MPVSMRLQQLADELSARHSIKRHGQIMTETIADTRIELFQHHASNRGHVEALGFGQRHPDELNELGLGPGYAFNSMGDGACIQGEEARVEPARAAGWSDCAADEMQIAEIRQDVCVRECRPWSARHGGYLAYRNSEQQARLLEGFADGR